MIISSKTGKITKYETYGDKENTAILLIHGLGAELSSWENQVNEYAEHGYYVIAMDMYGHGESSNLDSCDLDEWDNQILNLLEHLEIGKTIICGVSMGGVIAQHFTVEHSERILALIVSDSFGELKTLYEKFLGFSQVIGFKVFKMLGKKRTAKLMVSAYKDEFASNARNYIYNQMQKTELSQLLKSRHAINKIDAIESMGKLDIPCLIIVGACFGKIFIDINKKISDAIKNSQFVILQKSMDPSPLVNSVGFNREVLNFLKSNAL